MKKGLSILIILLVAIFLRCWQLDKVPPSLFGDEVDVGYQAYSILKTGKDLQGNVFPALIQSLSEYRAPGFIYSAVPFVAIFGLNEWGVRLPAVFWGIVSIFGIYLLIRKLISERVALFSALSLSLSPWHIQYSRAGFEVSMLLGVLILAVYFFIKGLTLKKYLILSGILFALTPYIYSTAAVFTPLLIIVLLLSFKPKITSLFTAGFVFLIVISPFIYQIILGRSAARFNTISIFQDQSSIDKVTLAQKAGNDRGLTTERFFYNKLTVLTNQFFVNYLRTFSAEFLFLGGDPNFRHSIHEMGEMYFYELIPLILGIGLLAKNKPQIKILFFGWLLIAPIPAAFTVEGGSHATRSFLILPPLVTMIGLGLNFLFEKFKSNWKYLSLLVLILVLFNASFYLHRYFINYPYESWRPWHFGFKEAFTYVVENQNQYDFVWINNTYEPSLIRFLFWTEYDPTKFQQKFVSEKSQLDIMNGFDGYVLDKYYFGKVNQPFEDTITSKILYIASVRDDITDKLVLENSKVKLLKTVYSPTNEPIFYILTGTR